MRPFFLMLSLLLIASFTLAQDNAAALASQQAMQQAQQANQQAMQQAQQANQQAMEASQRANEELTRTMMQNQSQAQSQPGCCIGALPPKFSMKSGHFTGPVTVRLTDATRGVYIYYTTDGWTPTTSSTRYRGPIVIDSTTTLNAIAVSSDGSRSVQSSAQYVINNGAKRTPAAQTKLPEGTPAIGNVPMRDGKPYLPQDTPVRLVFATALTSKTASVGDKVAFTLAEDIKLGDTLVASKGASSTGTVAQVDRTGAAGVPGTLTVEVDSLQSEFGPIPLYGSVTKEGNTRPPNAEVLIPAVGPLFVLKHGTDAVITPGAALTVAVAADTPISRSN
jgi:Chitobiase/beta-hexosaminidase C-terminal domain